MFLRVRIFREVYTRKYDAILSLVQMAAAIIGRANSKTAWS